MVNRLSAEALWQFSLALYPKVQPLCLQWQDELGANVNLLLLLCYLEQQQLSIGRQQLQQLQAELENFSARFTRPLRQLRRRVSESGLDTAMQQQLKQTLLASELDLERLEQKLLVQHCPALAMQPAQVLELYLQLLNADASAVAGQLIDLRQALYK
ncbi:MULTISPECIES: TIGR02444 family protein [unclassified Arsukibacterium]|uniref:TIGR02444 family protein n=1 Tax=unclassified Arsukibacterium TaxID=2635278 RepID=UPI000C63714C|nr:MULTISPECIES: TIGR02444 family protein [unclassified Arsukibacterium]MAA94273.1 TIGR02444 family protein [Rheinheimera sp.]MBM34653.1 TIGR02444 family protein [Rheinheimera sp.]|tara:strand:+ start:94 stop:564 length:471 start_codon:yes stop_codon:yes gene_type:complete